MTTPDYYKYDDGETHFECFDISRYYSGDWAQVIQYVFRWQKKGGVEDLKKALATAKDAQYNGIIPEPITKSRTLFRAVNSKIRALDKNNFGNASKIWEDFMAYDDGTSPIIKALEEMIEDAENAERV